MKTEVTETHYGSGSPEPTTKRLEPEPDFAGPLAKQIAEAKAAEAELNRLERLKRKAAQREALEDRKAKIEARAQAERHLAEVTEAAAAELADCAEAIKDWQRRFRKLMRHMSAMAGEIDVIEGRIWKSVTEVEEAAAAVPLNIDVALAQVGAGNPGLWPFPPAEKPNDAIDRLTEEFKILCYQKYFWRPAKGRKNLAKYTSILGGY